MPMLNKVNNITFPFPSFPPYPPRNHHRRRLPLSPRQVNQIATRPAGGLKNTNTKSTKYKYKYKVNQIATWPAGGLNKALALASCPRLSLLAMSRTSKIPIT